MARIVDHHTFRKQVYFFMKNNATVYCTGASAFRTRILLSFLSCRPLCVSNIRIDSGSEFGLRDYEIHFLKCFSQLTDGTSVEINEAGTSFKLTPGIINGGSISFDCGLEKPIGYYLEMLIPLVLFAKKPVSIILSGITQSSDETSSIDAVKMVNLGILRAWGIKESSLDLKIQRRGFLPNGGGQILFTSPICSKGFTPRQFIDPGLIKKIRGIASCSKVSSFIASRMIDSSKMTLSKLLPDALIYSDARRGSDAGESPGYALTLIGESTTKSLIIAEGVAEPGEIPEEFAQKITNLFLSKAFLYGWGDVSRQWLILLLAALSSEDVSSITLGSLTPFTIEFLRELYVFFGITFRLKENTANGTVLATCTGTGFRSVAYRSS